MKPILLHCAAPLCFAAVLSSPASAELPADVLARSPEAALVRADWDAELTRVPADQRVAVATSPERVQTVLNNLLVNRTLAERARGLGADKDPVVQRRFLLEAERVLAALMIERIEIEAAMEFDRAAERNIARARELYLIDRAKYVIPEEVEVSHILFDPAKRGKDAALAAARDARAKLLGGGDIAVLALELSDDPSAKRNNGRLGMSPRGRFDPTFESAAFALKNLGDVSEPVLTRFGYHVIRLEGRKPARARTFDEVRDGIVADLRVKYVNDKRDAAIATIRSDRRLEVNQEAVDALVVKVDFPALNESLLKVPNPEPVSPPK